MFKTWQAVVKKKYIDPEEMISFSSSIKDLAILRSEICTIPRKYVNSGKIQLYTKQEMKSKFGLSSPNMADAVMMLMSEKVDVVVESEEIVFDTWY